MNILWKMEHSLLRSKCSIFHNILKYIVFQGRQKALSWSKGLMDNHRDGRESQLFACWVILHAFVVCGFFSELAFLKISFRNTIRVTNSLDPDHDLHFVDLDLGPNCIQSYQQTTRGNKRR